MGRRLFLVLSFLASMCVVPVVTPSAPASASPLGVYIFNTPLSSNKGLGFCAADTVKGCIESVTVDGVPLVPVFNPTQAHYGIGGGVYGGPCRFVDTTVAQCEYPYLVVYPGYLRPSSTIGSVVVNFRRQASTHPTASVNAVIVNGVLQSFTPAAPGVGDVASISANASEIHGASSGYCVGWVIEIDTCAIGETATWKVNNRVSMLLLPAMRSSVVPPDFVDDTCRQIDPSNNCLINVFDETSRGGWVDTDASVFGLTSTDRYTGAAQLKIAGPHFRLPVNGSQDLNLSYFRMFLPTAYLSASFGLTPQQANATTLPVRRTVGSGSTVPDTQYVPSDAGLLVNTTGIGFSIPTVSVQRVLVVKKNKKITADTILKAAGVFQTKKFGAARIVVSTKNGMKYSAKRYSFSKAKTVTVTVRYRSTKQAVSERRLTVKVTR